MNRKGLPISIHGDLEVLSNDISFDGNTITSSPTTISGNDISFTAAGEILNWVDKESWEMILVSKALVYEVTTD